MQFPGDCKDGMIIGNRQLFPLPFFKPCLPVGFVAGGTASIFAGVIGIAQMIAVAAPYRLRYSEPQDRKISATPAMITLQIGGKLIHGFNESMESFVCQVGVASRCLGALMSQEFLDYSEVDAPLQ